MRGGANLMVTCLVDLLRPEAGEAAVRTLRRCGYRVAFAEGQTCCGQPAWNSGFHDEARRVAAPTLKALAATQGPIVCLSGSCAATVQHAWPELFGDDAAADVAARTVEYGAFLAPLARDAEPAGERRPVAWHCSCHQRRYLGDTTSGEALLAALGGVERVTPRGDDLCCGFGGSFAVKFSHVSGAMGRERVAAFDEAGAAEVVSGDLGCLLHLDGCARAAGSPMATTSLAELLEREGFGA